MKLLLAGGILLVSLFGLCSDEPEPEDDDSLDAIMSVQPLLGDSPHTPPVIDDSYNCTITFPPEYDEFQPVPAICRWDVEEQDTDLYLVTYRSTWACEDFTAENAEGYPPCDDVTGFHEWEYSVDLLRGQVELLDETGQFPPEYVR